MPDSDALLEPSGVGSTRPPTRVPGIWGQIPTPVRVAMVALLLVAGGGLYGVTRLSAQSSVNLDNGAIRQLIPAEASKVPQQSRVGIVLAGGYTASLSVNGVPIPDSQTDRIVAFNQVTFQPGPGRVFERWDASVPTCVTATYWRYASGQAQSKLRTWCFSVI